ncbi:MAG: polysulfide reductase NrfD [Magnetococcales bacterium]|nr:polysulfide reductase NrfD [Magnetococcales bacterium]
MSDNQPKLVPSSHIQFFKALLEQIFVGSRVYGIWMVVLLLTILQGGMAYRQQAIHGLAVTGLSDQITWGLYIGNFTFFVGVAAAAVILIIPAYLFHRREMRRVTLLGECLAVAAVVVALLFVTVDLGQPLRIWHALPFLGKLNFPTSILAWDMVVLTFYLLINILLLWYLLYKKFCHHTLQVKHYFPLIIVAIILGLSIHTVTAFMLSGNPSRPFWHTAILAPRFIASAFAAGAALMIITFQILHRFSRFRLSKGLIREVALIMAFSQFISLFLLGSEFYTALYRHTAQHSSAVLLYWGTTGSEGLTTAIYLALSASLIGVVILMVRSWREHVPLLNLASVLIFFAIWMEKGIGLVVPGFTPTPLGEIAHYSPTTIEIQVTVGIWAVGAMIFTILARITIAIEYGHLKAIK